MNELSLFTGAGGGILGTYLLGFRPIGYVEWDGYCQRVLAQRIKDGILHEAPIFCDVRAFIGEGYAASYTGMVDVLTAGFPCQPFSVAGKRKGVDDERNMWPATADVIRIVRPRRVLLENVPGIREYLPVVIRDLRRLGYSVRRPLILGADDCGAKHRRERIWIMASDSEGVRVERRIFEQGGRQPGADGDAQQLADTARIQQGREEQRPERERIGSGSERGGVVWWESEPDVGRVAHGVASRVDRLKAIGNGQVPAVVRAAWEILSF